MRMAIALVLIAAILPGCGPMFSDTGLTSAVTSGSLRIGMSLEEVIAIVGHKPNTITDDVLQTTTSQGEMITWRPGWKGTNLAHAYELKFVDRKLVEWSRR